MGYVIVDAGAEHVEPIRAIYNHEIREGLALWNTREREPQEMAQWFVERKRAGLPVLAACDAGELIGYASFGPFRPHDGYAQTVEHSLYVSAAQRGRGVGRALLNELIARAQAYEAHAMIGAIEAGNAASIELHKSLGFFEAARLPEAGRKFERWLTLVLMQRMV